MLQEFKEFINKGSVLDLAVAVIIGAAFGAIISSLVDDILMPLIGIIIGGISFENLVFEVGDAMFAYGNFIQAIVNFLIIAFVIFLIVRQANKMKAEEPPAPPPGPTTEELLVEIRDLLKKQN